MMISSHKEPWDRTYIQSSRMRYGCHVCEFVNRKTGKVLRYYSPVDSRRLARKMRPTVARLHDLLITDIEIRIIHRGNASH